MFNIALVTILGTISIFEFKNYRLNKEVKDKVNNLNFNFQNLNYEINESEKRIKQHQSKEATRVIVTPTISPVIYKIKGVENGFK